MDIIFWEFWLIYQIFFSPQVKRSVVISNKHGIYGLLHKLPKDLVKKDSKKKLGQSKKLSSFYSLNSLNKIYCKCNINNQDHDITSNI